MIANRLLMPILGLCGWVFLPIQIVATLALGIAVKLTFGLFLLPISFVWVALLCPMLGLSWACHKAPALRNLVGIVFIPWAIVANTFAALMPSMGEFESRASKLMLCDAWPFTWEFWQFLRWRLDLASADPASVALNRILARVSDRVPLYQRVIMRVAAGQEFDSDVLAADTVQQNEACGTRTVDRDRLVHDAKRLQRRQRMTLEGPPSFDVLHRAALAGQGEAQYLVSKCYFDGTGVDKDVMEALAWLHISAESGFVDAQALLAHLCYHSDHDYVEAAKWYRKAAEQADASAQCELANCSFDGEGVPQDYAEAVKWNRKAAAQGNAVAQKNLGVSYDNGYGVPQDHVEAVKWYQTAADQGLAGAQNDLGVR